MGPLLSWEFEVPRWDWKAHGVQGSTYIWGEVARPVAWDTCSRRDVEDGSFASVCVSDCVCLYRRVKNISMLNLSAKGGYGVVFLWVVHTCTWLASVLGTKDAVCKC